ncbi:MAG: hypothetical protein H0U35_05510 [Sporichthyaceae bacterium]|nr:hypothetical protein [Sporichthyaceae bacterium]
MPDQEPADDREPMDETAVRKALGKALALQARSLVEMTLLAGALTGMPGVGAKNQLRQFVQHELEDTYLLTEKLTALGGAPKVEVGVLEPAGKAADVLARLIEHEHEVVAALHAVIPHSGQEPRSEALEHLLEHVIMRKQQQTDYLSLALA